MTMTILKAQNILDTIKALSILLEKENLILQAREYDRLIEIGKEKAGLAQTFHDLFTQISAEKEKLANLPEAMKMQMESAWENFVQIGERNADLLDQAASVNQQVAERIVEATREALNALEGGYSDQGTSRAAHSSTAFKLNETL